VRKFVTESFISHAKEAWNGTCVFRDKPTKNTNETAPTFDDQLQHLLKQPIESNKNPVNFKQI